MKYLDILQFLLLESRNKVKGIERQRTTALLIALIKTETLRCTTCNRPYTVLARC